MNILKIAIILSSTATASAANTSSASPAPPSPPSVLDSRIEIKVNKWVVPDELNLIKQLTNASNDSSAEFRTVFKKFQKDFRVAKIAAIELLDKEKEVLDNLSEKVTGALSGRGSGTIIRDAHEPIAEEKSEWVAREESFSGIFPNFYITNKGNMNNSFYNAKTLMEYAFKRATTKKCKDKSLFQCTDENFDYDTKIVKPIKAWIFGRQMFGEPLSKEERDLYVKQNWKPDLKRMKVPADRFAISHFDNSDYNPTEPLEAAYVEKIKNFVPEGEEKNIRLAVLEFMQETLFYQKDNVPITIQERVRAFERIVEAFVRNSQRGKFFNFSQVDANLVNRYIKAWLLAVQMFDPLGKYGDFVPKFVTPASLPIAPETVVTSENSVTTEHGGIIDENLSSVDNTSSSSSPSTTNAPANNEKGKGFFGGIRKFLNL